MEDNAINNNNKETGEEIRSVNLSNSLSVIVLPSISEAAPQNDPYIQKTPSLASLKTSPNTTQFNSGIEEIENNEIVMHPFFLLKLFDETIQTKTMVLARASIMLVLICLFGTITFAAYFASSNQMIRIFPVSIVVGFLISCFVIAIASFIVDIKRRAMPEIGKDMVQRFTWFTAFNAVYDLFKQLPKGDARVNLFNGRRMDVMDENSRYKRKIKRVQAISRRDLKVGENEDENDKINNYTPAYHFDFVGDTGDGFDPTYAIFSSIAKSEIQVHISLNPDSKQEPIRIPKADSVFVGGSVAHPAPRHEVLMSRFIRPLSWAYPSQAQLDSRVSMSSKSSLSPTNSVRFESSLGLVAEADSRMYVIPGQNEWSDGLVNFKKLVLDRDFIGSWRTPANSSYFAVRLPHDWWIICVDLGPDCSSDMDEGQVDYFTKLILTEATADDRFILMQRTTDWIKNSTLKYGMFKNFQKFRQKVLGDRLRLSIASGFHYYRRMEEANKGTTTKIEQIEGDEVCGKTFVTDKAQLIVAGHGGAYSQPTSNPDIKSVKLGEPWIPSDKQTEFCTVTSYPSTKESVLNIKKNLFNLFNWRYGFGMNSIVGAKYMLMFAAVSPLSISEATIPNGDFIPATWPNPTEIAQSPLFMLQAVKSVFFYVAIFWIAFDSIAYSLAKLPPIDKVKYKGISFSIIHSILHIGFAFLCRRIVDIIWGSIFYATSSPTSIQNQGLIILYCFLTCTSMYILGYFVAVHLTAIFFYTVLIYGGDGLGYDEASSALMDKDHKGFIRVQVDKNGNLVIYSIGIEKTPLNWYETEPHERTSQSPGVFVPSDANELKLFLIEKITLLRNENQMKVEP